MEIRVQISGPGDDRNQTLTLGSASIGRQDCDITLSDSDQVISRLHARLSTRNGEVVVRDESVNGTWLGNRALPTGDPVPVPVGAILGIGPYSITIESIGESDEDSPPSTEFPILERHQILELLGQGGMATVYRARDRATGNIVALKVLHRYLVERRGFIQRFRQEARLASGVISPHALRVYEYYHDGPHHVLLMEFLDGETLKARLERSERLGEDETLKISQEIAKALESAGRRLVIHRDIKPSNVMLTSRGAVLMDFGIARATSSSTISSEVDFVGTVQYCSPEQAAGVEVDPRSDLYSLGIVLFECLIGKPPFEADDPLEVLRLQQHQIPPNTRFLRPMISAATSSLITLLLEKRPEDRLASAMELSHRLAEVQRGDRPSAPRPKAEAMIETATDDLASLSSRSSHKAFWWIIGIALLIGLITVMSIVNRSDPENRESLSRWGLEATDGVHHFTSHLPSGAPEDGLVVAGPERQVFAAGAGVLVEGATLAPNDDVISPSGPGPGERLTPVLGTSTGRLGITVESVEGGAVSFARSEKRLTLALVARRKAATV